jgi:hypothetical protein
MYMLLADVLAFRLARDEVGRRSVAIAGIDTWCTLPIVTRSHFAATFLVAAGLAAGGGVIRRD